jgi:hypothetical protein
MQTNPSVKLYGFRVYINGKQYGADLAESIRSIRVNLSLEKPVHVIYVTAYTNRPKLESQSSNVVHLSGEQYLPFTYYCYHDVHRKNTSYAASFVVVVFVIIVYFATKRQKNKDI